MNAISRPVLRYHGGKWMLALWIISHFPEHRIYVEPFGGAASVLLRKKRVYAEVYNDRDEDVVNLFRVLRDSAQSRALIDLLKLTPFARSEFSEAYGATLDPVERARRLVIRSFMGFGSGACNPDHRTGFRGKSFRSGTSPAWDWRNYVDALPAVIDRFQGVCIECRSALDLIRSHDRADVLFYVDPPYMADTRSMCGDVYRHEMTNDDHLELLRLLRTLKGKVVLSGYRNDLYDSALADWRRVEKETYGSGRNGAVSRTETLWLSPNIAPNDLNLWGEG